MRITDFVKDPSGDDWQAALRELVPIDPERHAILGDIPEYIKPLMVQHAALKAELDGMSDHADPIERIVGEELVKALDAAINRAFKHAGFKAERGYNYKAGAGWKVVRVEQERTLDFS